MISIIIGILFLVNANEAYLRIAGGLFIVGGIIRVIRYLVITDLSDL